MPLDAFSDPSHGSPLIIAHRGARSIAPENTILAAECAAACGADGWEFDVRLTRDGEPVLMHDETLARTCPEAGNTGVHELRLSDVLSLDAGSWFARQDPFGTIRSGEVGPEALPAFTGARIPTLARALEVSGRLDLAVNVEIKDVSHLPGSGDAAEIVAETIRAAGMEKTVLVSSFNWAYLDRVRAVLPDTAVALLADRLPEGPVACASARRAAGYHLEAGGVDPDSVAALRGAGLRVGVFTVNDPEQAAALTRMNVTSIITDFPHRFSRRKGPVR